MAIGDTNTLPMQMIFRKQKQVLIRKGDLLVLVDDMMVSNNVPTWCPLLGVAACESIAEDPVVAVVFGGLVKVPIMDMEVGIAKTRIALYNYSSWGIRVKSGVGSISADSCYTGGQVIGVDEKAGAWKVLL